MSYITSPYIDEELIDQCDQIRAIASKNWLSSAHVSLKHLDQVKTSVYNVGLRDPKDLKATNLIRHGRSQSFTDLTADPPLSTVSLQRTAWGSNGSIADLESQQSFRSNHSDARQGYKKTRPSSAKVTRPASAKVTRPSSAKGSQLPPKPPSIGVKGARFDASGKPPKHSSHHTGTGWVGPPAGMKFSDQDQINLLQYTSNSHQSVLHETPVPPMVPCGTPVPPSAPCGTPVPSELGDDTYDQHYIYDANEKPESISIHLPTATAVHEEEDTVKLTLTHNATVLPPKPTPEPIQFSLPKMEDDAVDSDLDTERLLAEAREHTKDNSSKTTESSALTQDGTDHSQASNNGLTSNPEYLFPDPHDDQEDNFQGDLSEDEEDLFIIEHATDPNFPPTTIEKHSVKFSDKNVTIDITPRNQGHKVSKNESTHASTNLDNLKSTLSVTSTKHLQKKIVTEEIHKENHLLNQGDDRHSLSQKSRPTSDLKSPHRSSTCEKRLSSPERPKSALKTHNRPSTPVSMVTVSYSEEESEKKKKKKGKKLKEVETMVEKTVLSDSEGETKEDITPDKLEPWMPTKCVSEPIKNYYEISRQAVAKDIPIKVEKKDMDTPVYKTTKTLEFDELKPKETNVRSIIDNNQLLASASKEREKFVGLGDGLSGQAHYSNKSIAERSPMKSRMEQIAKSKRPASAKVSSDTERPGSRLGYVAMAPNQPNNKMLRRPLSATKPKRPVSASAINARLNHDETENNKNANDENRTDPKSNLLQETDKFFADIEKQREREREKQIDELIKKHLKKPHNIEMKGHKTESAISHQTKSLLEDKISTEISSPRNELASSPRNEAESLSIETADQHDQPGDDKSPNDLESVDQDSASKEVKTSAAKTSTKKVTNVMLKLAEDKVHAKLTDHHRHYASYSRGRVRSAPACRHKTAEPKIRYTKPTIINTRNPDNDVITDIDIETHTMSQKLAEDGVHIRPEVLERALYPPSGRTTYYEINATLPKSTSVNLLSHPKVWLPVEYKQFKLAEKNLARANEIMYRQKLVEERKARLAELGAAAKKKKKKKGKKKGTLRRSQSVC